MPHRKPELNFPTLGHDVIDREHKELLQLISQLYTLIDIRTEDETIIKLLNLLISRSAIHFKTEEKLLDALIASGYSKEEADLHKKQHNETLEAMIDRASLLKAEIEDYKTKFKTSIHAWSEHLCEYDKELVEHLKNLERRKLH